MAQVISLALSLLIVISYSNQLVAQAQNIASMESASSAGMDSPGIQPSTEKGHKIFQAQCAACHQGQIEKAPHISVLKNLSPDLFMASLTTGAMSLQGKNLTKQDKESLSLFVTGEIRYTSANVNLNFCRSSEGTDNKADIPAQEYRLWGSDYSNSRALGDAGFGDFAKGGVSLEPVWSFAFPSANRARSQPAIVEGMLITGSQGGTVYAFDALSGCVQWTYRASAEVRTGITVDPPTIPKSDRNIYFGDFAGKVYAVNLHSGQEAWQLRAETHPAATITAQPQLAERRLYVSVSSREFLIGADSNYPCCTFRGSVLAVDAINGKKIWQSYVMDEPKEVGRNAVDVPILAPSGAPIWNTPTVDLERGQLYVGTGENYSRPTSNTSDAIVAFNLKDGSIAWVTQTTPKDAWNVACTEKWKDKTNCPEPSGPDYDYGAPPILVNTGEKDLLIAGQKSGVVYGINPDDGKILWNTRVGRGSAQGGIHFGMAADRNSVYVGVSDFELWASGPDTNLSHLDAKPGLTAVSVTTGEILWHTPAVSACPEGDKLCAPGISAPVTFANDLVFAGHSDGMLRIYDSRDGEIIWEQQTARDWVGSDGRKGHGGSIGGGSGPIPWNGLLYVNSGYGTFSHMPGNMLIAYRIVKD